MGLDMYLYAKKHLFLDDEEKAKKISEIIQTDLMPTTITFEVGYWRKANAVHKWFVDNVQNGVDDCKEYYVSKDKLKILLAKVSKILKDNNLAKDLLPTRSGFFFGDTEYNEFYFSDLEDTKKIIKKALKMSGDYYLFYSSSW